MNSASRIVCNLRRLLPVLIILALYTAPKPLVRAAAAQGTFGTLPDPITTRELMNYSHRLGLSSQQRQAVLAFHDQYKLEFRILREGEIADFMEELRNSEGGSMPQRKVMENILKGMNRLNARIAAVDRRLMDQIQTILSEDQVVSLGRVRMARERKRLSSQWMIMFAGGPPVDISELFTDLDLTPEEHAASDPAVGQYEIRLTSSLRDLRETSLKMIMELYDAMQEMGFDEEALGVSEEDPEATAEMIQAVQTVFMQIMEKAMAAGRGMKELNKQTYRTVTSLLPPRPARVFRNRFLTQSYSQANFAIRDFWPWREIARESGELTDEQVRQVGDIADQLQARYDEIADRAVVAIEEFEAANSFFNFDQSVWEKLNEAQQQGQADCAEALESALSQIGEFASDELILEFRRQTGRMWTEQDIQVEEESQIAEQSPDDLIWSGDMFLPGPISRTDLGEYGRQLGLADSERAVIDQLHEDYITAYEQLQASEVKAVTDANSALWRSDASTGERAAPKPEAVAEVYRLRRNTQQAIESLDATFFDNLSVVLTGKTEAERVPRLRLARLRRCCDVVRAVSPGFGFAYGGGESSGIDLSELITQQQLLTADDLAKADAILAEYEEALTGAMRRWRDLAMTYQEANENWSVSVSRVQSADGGGIVDWSARYRQAIGSTLQDFADSEQAIGDLNRATLDKLIAVLSPGKAGSLRRAYDKKAYPSIYNDPASVDEHLNRALALGDLTPDQRKRLSEIAADYRPAYEALCQRLIKLGGMPRWDLVDEDFDWQSEQERQQKVATVNFDRDEISARAAAQLAAILTEEQIRRIGGLPEPPEDKNPWGY